MPASVTTQAVDEVFSTIYVPGNNMYVSNSLAQMVPPVPLPPPNLKVTVQPKSKMRFRYTSEKGSHGAITGEKTGNEVTYPTVQLCSYNGKRPVYITASLYTGEEPPQLHVHKLMGCHCDGSGTCTLQFDDSMTAVFQKLNIIYTKASDLAEVLLQRKVSNASNALTGYDVQMLRAEAKAEAKLFKARLSSVKMHFEAFCLAENGNKQLVCPPVLSNPIMHQTAVGCADLVIVRVSKVSSFASGGEEVFLLCEKVDKKNIGVKFIERDEFMQEVWSTDAPTIEVHHQYAMVFKTPPYRDKNISEPVEVFICLYRASDGERSNEVPFRYIPNDIDSEGTSKKRKKVNSFEESKESDVSKTFMGNLFGSSAKLPSFTIRQNSGTSDFTDSSPSPSTSSGVFSPSSTDQYSDNSLPLNDFNTYVEELWDANTTDVARTFNFNTDLPFDLLGEEVEENLVLSSDVHQSQMQTDGLVKPTRTSEYNPYDGRRGEEQSMGQMFAALSLDKERSSDATGDSRRQKVKLFVESLVSGQLTKFLEEVVIAAGSIDHKGQNLFHLAVLSQARQPHAALPLYQQFYNTACHLANQKNQQKQTPVHLAVSHNCASIVRMLLICGGDVNIPNGNGDTAIHVAVKYQRIDCLKIVLKYKGKICIDAVNNEGLTALHCAVLKKDAECVQLLCENGAHIDSADRKSGKTALHVACEIFPEVVEFMVKQQPSSIFWAMDYAGNYPIHLAVKNGFYDIAELLIDSGSPGSLQDLITQYDNEESDITGPVALQVDNPSPNAKVLESSVGHASACPKAVPDDGNIPQSTPGDDKSLQSDSGYLSGTIELLSADTMRELGELLDPPSSDWERLAMCLGFDDYHLKQVPKLGGKKLTETFIHTFLDRGHGIEELMSALEILDLTEALDLLKRRYNL